MQVFVESYLTEENAQKCVRLLDGPVCWEHQRKAELCCLECLLAGVKLYEMLWLQVHQKRENLMTLYFITSSVLAIFIVVWWSANLQDISTALDGKWVDDIILCVALHLIREPMHDRFLIADSLFLSNMIFTCGCEWRIAFSF
jgi:predicted ABC-type exoprotein transport system permease subunit